MRFSALKQMPQAWRCLPKNFGERPGRNFQKCGFRQIVISQAHLLGKGAHPSGNGVTNAIKAQCICAQSELRLLKKAAGVALPALEFDEEPGSKFQKMGFLENCHCSGAPVG